MPYVYRHIRLDKNETFYIGIGSDKKYNRAYQKTNRNKYWKNIIQVSDYQIEILEDNLSWQDACKKEIELIKLYGRKDLGKGSLVNMTDGGQGAYGLKLKKHTQEWKSKMSQFMIGNSNGKGYKHTQEAKDNISKYRKGKKITEETRKKLSSAQIGNTKFKGLKHTEETKLKIGKSSSERMKEYWRKKKGSVETPPFKQNYEN